MGNHIKILLKHLTFIDKSSKIYIGSFMTQHGMNRLQNNVGMNRVNL